MSAIPSSRPLELFADLWPVSRSVAAPATHPAHAKNDRSQNRPFPISLEALDNVRPLAFARYLAAFFVGVAATVAWQSYGGPAREMIAPALPSSYQEQLNTMSLDLNAVRQSMDHMITSFAISQKQTTRSVDQLAIEVAAGREQMTQDITGLETVEQYILSKISIPPTLPPVARPAQPPSKALLAFTHAKNP